VHRGGAREPARSNAAAPSSPVAHRVTTVFAGGVGRCWRERTTSSSEAEGAKAPAAPSQPPKSPRLARRRCCRWIFRSGIGSLTRGFEWEVLTHPAAMHGAKTLRARVVRPGVPETEREVIFSAHERIQIRRDAKP
jgi:hypothetical protein